MPDFQQIENISTKQRDISNALLIHSLDDAVASATKPEVRERRKTQLKEYREKLGLRSKDSKNLPLLAAAWIEEEQIWITQISGSEQINPTPQLSYRILAMFLRNHSQCPFTEEKTRFRKPVIVADTSDFEKANQKTFLKFLEHLEEELVENNSKIFRKLLTHIRVLQQYDIDQEYYSALHKLFDKDTTILKGMAIGGSAGVATSLILGPIIGTWIGEAVGLYGAAATSYGLALLGGGSVASGGFGMIGGSIVIGLASSLSTASQNLKGEIDTDMLQLSTASKNLPILLAIGAIHQYESMKSTSKWISKTIKAGLKEAEKRLTEVGAQEDGSNQTLDVVKSRYERLSRAKDMSENYDWYSGYDATKFVINTVKGWF